MSVKLVYFAWIRERIGLADETVELPDSVKTGEDLLSWLQGRGENYAYALDEPLAVRMAVDQELIEGDDHIAGATEIALFPPMTGG